MGRSMVSRWRNFTGMALSLSAAALLTGCMQGDEVLAPREKSAPLAASTAAAAGRLSISVDPAPVAEYNLSNPGGWPHNPVQDWCHWGRSSATDWNRKSNGAIIGNFRKTGPNPQRYTNPVTGFTWTDGTPTASQTNTKTGIFLSGKGSNFQLDVKADQIQKELYLFISAFKARGRLTAKMSDGSAPQVSDATISSTTGNSTKVVRIVFSAGSSGQICNLTWSVDEDFGGGNVTLQAATVYATNRAPSMTWSLDQPNSQLYAYPQNGNLATVAWKINPSDMDGQVASVTGEWSQDGVTNWTGLQTRTAAPWDLKFTNLPAGVVKFRFRVKDLVGSPTTEYQTSVQIWRQMYIRGSVPIPDANPSGAVMELPAFEMPGLISGLYCSFRVTHTYIGDLEVTLIHPDGSRNLLAYKVGGSQDNFQTVYFNDGYPKLISEGTHPYLEGYKPVHPFSSLIQKSSSGVWKLEVRDHDSQDVGVIEAFSLDILVR